MAQKIPENLETQLSELEALQAVFCNPGEIRIEDPSVLADINAFVNGHSKTVPPYLDVTINILLDDQKFELCVNLSQEYPDIEPDLYVRNPNLNKKEHANLNRDLTAYISSLDRSEPCVFSATSWLQDNAQTYIIPKEVEVALPRLEKDRKLLRFWIYSHHIYSKSKRREINDLANSLNITGFCMPGKPGIICVEGSASDCNDWWQTIKSMNWKRIFCKVSEECKGPEEDFLRFSNFEEVVFQNSSIKCNHMDMGELLKYLEDHKCEYIFKDIFGV